MRRVPLLLICCFFFFLSSCEVKENEEIIQSNANYVVTKINNQYFCSIYNRQGDKIKYLGPTYKEPGVCLINDHVIKYSTQAGAGYSTRITYYYDITSNILSQKFYGVFDETDDLVAYYGGVNQINVKSIFSDTTEIVIDDFDNILSPSVEPFVSVEFVDNNNSLAVKFFSGSEYVVKERIIPLNQEQS